MTLPPPATWFLLILFHYEILVSLGSRSYCAGLIILEQPLLIHYLCGLKFKQLLSSGGCDLIGTRWSRNIAAGLCHFVWPLCVSPGSQACSGSLLRWWMSPHWQQLKASLWHTAQSCSWITLPVVLTKGSHMVTWQIQE